MDDKNMENGMTNGSQDDNKNNDNEKQNHRKKICICDGMRHNKNHSPGAGGFSLHEN